MNPQVALNRFNAVVEACRRHGSGRAHRRMIWGLRCGLWCVVVVGGTKYAQSSVYVKGRETRQIVTGREEGPKTQLFVTRKPVGAWINNQESLKVIILRVPYK
jgi:predicted acetyltransferase